MQYWSGWYTKRADGNTGNEYLDELAFLAETAGRKPLNGFALQNCRIPDSRTLLARKLEEIKQFIIFKGNINGWFWWWTTGSQIQNIEKELKVKKRIDRSDPHSDIFAARAKTAQPEGAGGTGTAPAYPGQDWRVCGPTWEAGCVGNKWTRWNGDWNRPSYWKSGIRFHC